MASHTTVRIDAGAQRTLKLLRRQTGETTPEILRKALEEYRRKHLLEGVAADFAALRLDAKRSADERSERALWDGTAKDGLED
jgi:hypothetical protein